ncbi:unnamed protein product [Macrosiphum euphorbiae]|uniref:Uncharacterized protein n=1 Tax=Macrosiphum euphorbiae TaxID=13131 RepID=A0AAV0Y0B3_9HEMI|nr:unnamed protein product [Macrosiphum euphorbiae]
MVRGKNRPLEQIGNRMAELFLITNSECSLHLAKDTQFPIFSQNHYNGPLPSNCISPQYKVIAYEKFKIKIESPNDICDSKTGDIIKVENICFFQDLNNCIIVGRKFLRCKDFFLMPCTSSSIGVYEVDNNYMSDINIWKVNEIILKYVSFEYKKSFVVFPLLHTT